MKKIAVRILIAFLILVILAVAAVGLFLDGAIKRGVEAIGPKLTKTDIKLQGVRLSLMSGAGAINGLVIGNPEGFKSPSAISVGTASLAIVPGSLLSDKIVIKSISVEAPEITFETDLKANNLSRILANVQEFAGGSGSGDKKAPAGGEPAKPGKKLEVDDFVIRGGKVHVSITTLGGKSATVALPEIHLRDLGKDSGGITPAELAKRVLEEVLQGATQAGGSAVTDLGKGLLDTGKMLEKTTGGDAQKITKGIGDLFKKKN